MLTKTEQGRLIVRLFQRDDGVLLPPDLSTSLCIQQPNPPVQKGEVLSFVDLDHFSLYEDAPPDFSPDALLSAFWRLHDNVDLAFRAAVTSRAIAAWGENERT